MWRIQGSAEPDGLQQTGHVPQAGNAGGPVMGMNPLVGHKVDRYWAEVGSLSLLCSFFAEEKRLAWTAMDCRAVGSRKTPSGTPLF